VTAEVSTAQRELLRHTLATLAYRGGKAVRDAPAPFASFKVSETSRTPVQILAHIGDLMAWGRSMADGTRQWKDSTPLPWAEEVQRFFRLTTEFDSYLASDATLQSTVEKLFQGPIADALTHVGQLTLLRRAFGAPIRGENYFKADIAAGRVGEDQAKPRVEFD
jgi:hypothetical protein